MSRYRPTSTRPAHAVAATVTHTTGQHASRVSTVSRRRNGRDPLRRAGSFCRRDVSALGDGGHAVAGRAQRVVRVEVPGQG